MAREKTIISQTNNIVYVEPNYTNSVSEYGQTGLEVFEFAPDLEDYSIFVNLEIETVGRTIQTGNKVYRFSYVSKNGSEGVNLMGGSKIKTSDGGVINSLTTNWTDAHISDLKEVGASPELFGINYIDIAYNHFMVPEVTIEFVDVRGASVFAQKELFETNNIERAIGGNYDDNVVNTFFQCFFTFPYPKFTLLVKGFYGQPVAYELTCADFRASFHSDTGNFSCTAKFVGYYFSFLNDVMVNALVAAPYSDYEGAKYWKERNFTFEGYNGGAVEIPKLAQLLKKVKDLEARSEHISQNSPEVQEKNNIEQVTQRYSNIKRLYEAYVKSISNLVVNKKDTTEKIDLFISDMEDGNISEAAIILVNNNAKDAFSKHFEDRNDTVHDAYEALKNYVEKFKEEYPSDGISMGSLPDFSQATPKQRIFQNGENRSHYIIDSNRANDDIKNKSSHLYHTFENKVLEQNVDNQVNKYHNTTLAYFYNDNDFVKKLNNAMKSASDKEKDVAEKIERSKNDSLAQSLGWYPTVENITKLMMAHFETFAHMVHYTALSISNENPQRDTKKVGITDDDDIADVPEIYRSSETGCLLVPPFPNVTKIVEKNGTRNREESWVGEYGNKFKEVDLVHGILNGIEEFVDTVNAGENTGSAGSTTSLKAVMKYPLSPLDFILTDNVYKDFDQNEVSSFLGLVGLRALQILGTPNISDWNENEHIRVLGKAEAENVLKTEKVSPGLINLLKGVLNSGVSNVISMLKGEPVDSTIPKPSSGIWPWQESAQNVGIVSHVSTALENELQFNICKVEGVNGSITYTLPLQNLDWDKIKKEVIHSKSAYASDDYFNISDTIITNSYKDNILYIDTNINRIKDIAENQLKDLDGIEFFREKITGESTYDKDKYLKFLDVDTALSSDNYKVMVAYPIKDAQNLQPEDKSCMIPCTTSYVKQMSWGGGYNMDNFHEYGLGGNWKDKNGEAVTRIKDDGYNEYFTELDTKSFTITEIPGLTKSLKPLTSTSTYPEVSLFTQSLYYKQTDIKVKAFMLLSSLSYLYRFDKIIDNEICNKDKTISIIPLPAVIYAGGVIWATENDYKNYSLFKGCDLKSNEYLNINSLKLSNLDGQVRLKLKKTFEKWVEKGIPNNDIIVSFKEIANNLEIKLLRKDITYDQFFNALGELESKNWIGINRTWFNSGIFKDRGYTDLLNLFVGEFGESFFRNYICVDEDLGGSKGDGTVGMRVGNRDGSPGVMQYVDFALAPCIFMKTTQFFFTDSKKVLGVPSTKMFTFFESFLQRITEGAEEEKTTDDSVAQAKETNTTTDIKVGVYRYCKLLYDKWIGGMSAEDFTEYTMEKFFSDDENDRYFYFIDAYYNKANDILVNIGDFCKLVEESYISADYSLLSLLSSVYSHNQFNFFCPQNFIDLSKRSNMIKMFDCIPYTEHWDVKRHPNFVVIYTYEPSSHLDIDGSEYENDSFMLNMPEGKGNKWPEALKSRSWGQTEGFSVPAFGVSYGKMYQSYFKDVNVSMDNPTVTEQSIKAQFAIACLNNESKNKEDDSTQYYYGQDLYAIYSNNSYTCEVTMMGCAWVQPLMLFVLTNIPMFRGTYQIIRVSHRIEQGNMVTKFRGVRMANVTTRLVEDCSVRRKNDQTDDGENTSINQSPYSQMASTDNDCPYPKYPVLSSDSAAISLSNDEDYNASQIMMKIMSRGYTKEQAAGIVGNMAEESPGFKANINVCDSNNNWAGGLCMWNADALYWLLKGRPDMIGKPMPEGESMSCPTKWEKKVNNDMPSADEQVTFLLDSLEQSDYLKKSRHVKQNLLTATTPEQAAFYFARDFENCKYCKVESSDTVKKRKNNAKRFYDNYSAKEMLPPITNNGDEKVSEIGNGLLHAINQTSMSSSVNVEVGIDKDKSDGNKIYLTNGKNSNDFGKILDIMLQSYSEVIEQIDWVVPAGGDQSLPPKAYIVYIKEGNSDTKVRIVSEETGEEVESIGLEEGGINEDFNKAIVKKYKDRVSTIRPLLVVKNVIPKMTKEQAESLFENVNITPCSSLANGESSDSSSSEGSSSEDNTTHNNGPFNTTAWDVDAFVKNLHYWQKNICERPGGGYAKETVSRQKYGGCGRCTGAVNRALRDTGFNQKYWATYPWQVCAKLKAADSDFGVVDEGIKEGEGEFPFGAAPKKGDICTFWAIDSNGNHKSSNFHTCAYDGSKWISDFVQAKCRQYNGESRIKWHRFRHK